MYLREKNVGGRRAGRTDGRGGNARELRVDDLEGDAERLEGEERGAVDGGVGRDLQRVGELREQEAPRGGGLDVPLPVSSR